LHDTNMMELPASLPDVFYTSFCPEVSSAASASDHTKQVSQSPTPAPIRRRLLAAPPPPPLDNKGGNWLDNPSAVDCAIVEHGSKTVVTIAEEQWNTSPRKIQDAPQESSSPAERSLLRNTPENKLRFTPEVRASPAAVCGEDADTIAEQLYAEIRDKFNGQPNDDHLVRLSSLRRLASVRRCSLPNADSLVRASPSSLRRSSFTELPLSPRETLD